MGEKTKNKKLIVLEKVGIFVGTLILVFFVFRFAIFFMPFLIAGVLALIIEPLIKFCMNKLKLSRRVSSFIVVSITIVLLIFLVIWGGSRLVAELMKFTSNIAPAITAATEFIDRVSNAAKGQFEGVSDQVISSLQNSVIDFIGQLGTYVGALASSALKVILSLPTVLVNVIITILALIFFTKDRIYVIDLLEYHFPKTWINNSLKVLKEVGSSIGGYIKVYLKIMVVTFAELFLAFNIFNWIGLDVPYPFALALLISFVDILPILGVGTVLNPWALCMLIVGNYKFAIALFITYIIIFCVRQFLEPKLVSNQFGIHPIITLMAMYAGFRFMGITGLIAGPIILMVLRCIFAPQIEKGLFKEIFDEK
ncbi:MAG: sporulation integral membrane protein YtvI [Clostridia bacterium]|nr:sporulation integral membrane protein YtvI [Clostridia bacterium]